LHATEPDLVERIFMDSSEVQPRQPGWRLRIACILAGVAVGSVGYAEEHCPVVEMLESAGGTIAESRPLFQWKPLPGVDRYRVRLQSRVPEGELVVSIDTLIEGTSFRPPRPLTSYRAMVTVLITAACSSGEAIDSGVRLLVDTSLGCAMDALRLDASAQTWTWNRVPGALDYEVLRFAMPSGKLLGRSVTAAPMQVQIDGEILAVRARCENGYSEVRLAP
jgi:hypothetical protein